MSMHTMKYGMAAAVLAAVVGLSGCDAPMRLTSPEGDVRVDRQGTITFRAEGCRSAYAPTFTVIRTTTDPALKMRPAGIPDGLSQAATRLPE